MTERYDRLTFKALNELVEFRTSIAIISSVLVGTTYAYFSHGYFRASLFIAMIIASIMLDGAATVFNHYFDFKKAIAKEGYLYNVHNPIVARNISPTTAFLIGIFLILIAGILGIYIILETNWILVIIGSISMLIAFLYSGGKHPISYTPFGEPVSGIFEGTIVISITYFIQTLSYSFDTLLISLPITLSISNIMLANNICDVDEDQKNGRNTLPILIGREKATFLLYLSHITMFVLNFIYIKMNYLPHTILLTIIVIPIMLMNLKAFKSTMTKANGFKYVLKNSLMFNMVEAIILLVTTLFF